MTALVHGKLLRRDRTFHTWKWRQVYLDKENLSVFNNKGAKRGEMFRIGSPSLTIGGPEISIRLYEAPKPHGFELRVRDEKMFFAAESETDRDRWVDALVAHWGAILDQASVNISTDRDRHHVLRSVGDIPLIEPSSITSLDQLGPMIEGTSTIQFPSTLKASGDEIIGVGSFIRRVRWADEPILAVALYIEQSSVGKTFDSFRDRSLESLYEDSEFYSQLIDAPFRKTFVFSCRKRLSRNGIIAALHDEIRPRIGTAVNELVELTKFIDKSLRKGESMICTIHPTSDILDFHFKGFSHPPLAAPALCRCLQAIFFDANSIQLDAKRGLIERIPFLWGQKSIDSMSESSKMKSLHLPGDNEPILEVDDDDDDEDDDEVDVLQRENSSKIDLECFGPMVDAVSNVHFPGRLGDGSILLGTRSPDGEILQHCSVGLYVDPITATEALLRFKGLSFGSMESDPEFFVAFTRGSFLKCIRIVATESTSIAAMANFLAALLREAHCETKSVHDLFHTLPSTLDKNDALLLVIDQHGGFHAYIESIPLPTTSPLTSMQQGALGTAIQSLFYGYHTPDIRARSQLMERLPMLLDHAKSDLVHTYRDEIVMLKENYKRLTPANRIKVGYMMLYHPRRKMMLKWSRRWCRLDGVILSIFSHKNKSRPKEFIVLSNCIIRDLSSHDEMVVELKKLDHIALVLGITQKSGEVLVLRADSVSEGIEWYEALTDASQLPMKSKSITSMIQPGKNFQLEQHVDDSNENFTEEKREQFEMIQGISNDREIVGSLIHWLIDDTRNQLVVLLLSVLVWSMSEEL